MSLTLITKANATGEAELAGQYKQVQLGPDYEFRLDKSTGIYTVTPIKYYPVYTTKTMATLDFSDAELFCCQFRRADGWQEDYQPDGGLKFWKLQRKVYRIIGNGQRVLDTTMYHDGDIYKDTNPGTELAHTMELGNGEYLHFEFLYANGKMEEIMNQADANKIQVDIKMRLKTGKCVVITTVTRFDE